MTMASSNDSRGLSSEINVTPLIDVLLVLLIIFMVIVPMVPKGQQAVVPQPNPHRDQVNQDRAIVVSLFGDAGSPVRYKINRDAVSRDELPARLAAIYANRAERILFVKGDDDISFSRVAEVIDMGHAAGVNHVALLTPRVSEGL